MNLRSSIIFLIFLVIVPTGLRAENQPAKGFVSWLPAASWEDALLTGNGTLGAMIMGDPFHEQIIINHALLYLPQEKPLVPPDMTPYLDTIKQLSFDGKYGAVANLGVEIWQEAGYGGKKWTDPYVPAADLIIDMPASNIEDYQRMVNYETAEATVAWTDERGDFTRKTFASRADTTIVTWIKGSAPFDAIISLKKHPNAWTENALIHKCIKQSKTEIKDGFMQYHVEYGQPHDYSPDGYDAILKITVKGGELLEKGSQYQVIGANEVLIVLRVEPYKGNNVEVVKHAVQKIESLSTDYNVLLADQKRVHGELYNRVRLQLPTTTQDKNLMSETLVSNVRNHSTTGILQRQFEAARYHILCATGINPPNLQGIWSGAWVPPWSSDFTHDGNVQMAISNLLNGNLPELMLGYTQYHEHFLDEYRVNAKQFYGAKGIHVPSHTSNHGYNNHYDETWCMEYWNGGAGWAAFYFYDYYLYSQDQNFLKDHAFPFMSEALSFWEDFLTMGKDGKYIVVPSYSPENNPLERRWQNSINATMDVMIIKELTRNWMQAAEILGVSKKEIRVKEEFLKRLPDYQISEEGVLREWLWDGFTDNQKHRHASHLYGVYEIPDPEILDSEALQAAVQKTILERLKIRSQHSGGEMAFGMCHLGFAAVNMQDKATATEILDYLSRFYWTNSMATTHNPGNLFNMDISGGIPSLMTRMVVNTRPGFVTLFPTLPDDWTSGQLNGTLGRGGLSFPSIQWNANQAEVLIQSKINQTIVVDYASEWAGANIQVQGAKFKKNGDSIQLNMKENQQVILKLERK